MQFGCAYFLQWHFALFVPFLKAFLHTWQPYAIFLLEFLLVFAFFLHDPSSFSSSLVRFLLLDSSKATKKWNKLCFLFIQNTIKYLTHVNCLTCIFFCTVKSGLKNLWKPTWRLYTTPLAPSQPLVMHENLVIICAGWFYTLIMATTIDSFFKPQEIDGWQSVLHRVSPNQTIFLNVVGGIRLRWYNYNVSLQ